MTHPSRHLSRRSLLGIGACGVAGLGLGALARAFPGARIVRRSAIAFGTIVSISLVGEREAQLEPAFAEAFGAIRAIEKAASLFDAHSEISRLNRDGVVDHPSVEFITLVAFALRLAEASNGAFDPTVQPVWLAWQAAKGQGRQPSPAELAAAVARIDYRALVLEPDRIRLAKPGMGLTLNALAQGFATDRVMAAAAAHGVRHAFIDTGEIGARGNRPGGQSWRVAIANPRVADRSVAELPLASRRFVATSADNACAWTADFSEHHIVEPWSGHSPRELAQVSVVASSGLVADGLSTVAMVVGRQRSAELLAIDPGASAMFIDKSGHSSAVGADFGWSAPRTKA